MGPPAVDPTPQEQPTLPAIAYERYPDAASAPLPATYRRREPESTVLYNIIREYLNTFLEEARQDNADGYPAFIERAFRQFLDCGVLSNGFARLRCPECGHERFVAFSCKGRLCPSCTARRMADTAARLVDDFLPRAAYRQWVISFPWPLRFRLAMDRVFLSRMLRAFLHEVFSFYRRRGRDLGITNGQPAAVLFVQRFGGALNLNPHGHSVHPDGLFVPSPSGPLEFVPLPPPTDTDIAHLTVRVARRLGRLARRFVEDDPDDFGWPDPEKLAVHTALSKALTPPVPKQTRLLMATPSSNIKSQCFRYQGYSIHAARTVAADDREGLERLCRYGLRAPFSHRRLSISPAGNVVYRLRRPWPTPQGVTQLELHPLEFLRRLAALIPSPYTNLVRYAGAFASRSRYRHLLPPPPKSAVDSADAASSTPSTPHDSTDSASSSESPRDAHRANPATFSPSSHTPPGSPPSSTETDPGSEPEPESALQSLAPPPRRRRLKWAQLLHRVFDIDALECPKCACQLVVLAFISDPPVVARILEHLKLPTSPPALAPSRPPDQPELFSDLPQDELPPETDYLDEAPAQHEHRSARAPPH